MSTHKNIDKICCVVLAITLVLSLFFVNAEKFGIEPAAHTLGYEDKLFNTDKVHTIDIEMDNWDQFLTTCTKEEYSTCNLTIDGEEYKNIAIRGKGNTSLTQVKSYGNNRYSFKVEFDHYDSTTTYHGLDKLCLNNIIQDNTYVKDYFTFKMMEFLQVPTPLCSFTYITVNGEDWGLYLAIEGVEDSFLQRNYGSSSGEIYKPDSMDMGGGRGNGENFQMEDETSSTKTTKTSESSETVKTTDSSKSADNKGDMKMGGGRSSDDVLLKYIDDNISSYSNIFNNAKTDVTTKDKERLIATLKTLSDSSSASDAVNINEVIRYFVAHNFVLNFDSYTGSMIHNYYLYEKDSKLEMIPWDYNLAFGGFQSMGGSTSLVNYPIDSPVSGGNTSDRPMISWIFNNEEYTEMYHEVFNRFIDLYFNSGIFNDDYEKVVSMISPYVKKDPTKFCTYDEFVKGTETLQEFCNLRAESIEKQLDGEIGLTSDTQKNDTLVDASHLTISDMGSMHGSMGENKNDNLENITPPGDMNNQGDMTPPDNMNNQGNTTPPEGMEGMTPPGDMNNQGNMTPPEGMEDMTPPGDMNNQNNTTSPGDETEENTESVTSPDAEANKDSSKESKDTNLHPDKTDYKSAIILIAGSTVLLLIGLFFAFKFKRRFSSIKKKKQ